MQSRSCIHPTACCCIAPSSQAAYHDWLLASGLLTPGEAALLAWAARPQDVRMRTRFKARANEGTYYKATALEALVSLGGGGGRLRWGGGFDCEERGEPDCMRACKRLPGY